jgi:hypothetical protein
MDSIEMRKRMERAAVGNVYVATTLRLIAQRSQDELALLRSAVCALAESNDRLLTELERRLAAAPQA